MIIATVFVNSLHLKVSIVTTRAFVLHVVMFLYPILCLYYFLREKNDEQIAALIGRVQSLVPIWIRASKIYLVFILPSSYCMTENDFFTACVVQHLPYLSSKESQKKTCNIEKYSGKW